MRMATIEELTLAIFSGVIHCCCIIAIVYTNIRFNRYKNLQALQKRCPSLVQLMSFCIVLYLTHHLTYKFAFIYDQNRTVTRFYQSQSIGDILTGITTILYMISIHGMTIVLVARSWLIYFNTNYSKEIKVLCIIPQYTIS